MPKFKSLIKKAILSCLIFVLLTFNFVPLAHAQAETGRWYSQSFQEWFTKVDESPENEIFGERYTAAQVQWVVYGLFYFIMNMATNGNTQAITCLMTKEVGECAEILEDMVKATGHTNKSPTLSFLGVIGSSPVSLSAYLKDVGQRLRLVPKVEAQGFGFTTGANPALELWKITRNLSYGLLIIAITIMSFMIMFRVKISPQVVISVQSALPKVIVALILITFSYAIAGLLIDLMYVTIGIVSAIIVNNGITNLSWLELFNRLTVERNVIEFFISYWFQFLLSAIVNWGFHSFGLTLVGAVSFFLMIFALIAFFVLLWYSIKVVILLLKTYVQIILLIIAAPFQILMGTVFPGAGFGPWLRSMAAQLAVYPFVGMMLVLASLFIRQSFPERFLGIFEGDFGSPFDIKFGFLSGQAWAPPLTAGAASDEVSKILWLLVSYSIILLIPKTAEIIQGFVSGKPFPYGTAIGEALGAPGRTVVTGMNLASSAQKFQEALQGWNIGRRPSAKVVSQTPIASSAGESVTEKTVAGAGKTIRSGL